MDSTGSTENPSSTGNTYETEVVRIESTEPLSTSDAPIDPTVSSTMIYIDTSLSFETTEPTITSEATVSSAGSSRSPSTTAPTTEFTTGGGKLT